MSPVLPPSSGPTPPPRRAIGRRGFLQVGAATAGAVGLASVLPATSAAAGPAHESGFVADLIRSVPFSFRYGRTSSRTLLSRWRQQTRRTSLPHGGAETTVTWTDPKTGLQVSWVADEYAGFPTVRWTVHLTNTGTKRSPQLTDVLALDLTRTGGSTAPWTIHTNNGSSAVATDFAPLDMALPKDSFRTFTTTGGRPTNGNATATGSAWNYQTGAGAPGYYQEDQHSSVTATSSATFTFTGNGIAWIGARNVDTAIADIYVDGAKVATVDTYASSWLKQQTQFAKDDLVDGQHRIEIVHTGRKNPAAIDIPGNLNIDAFTVTSAAGDTVVNDTDPAIVYRAASTERTNINNGWPYLNLDWGRAGMLVALGWPGQWAMEARRSGNRAVQLRGGMSHNDALLDGDDITAADLTSLYPEPGESIRTPSIVLLPWQGGDWIDAQNVWRRWFVDHNLPQRNGRPVPPLAPTQSNDYFVGQLDTAQDELDWLNAYGANRATAGTGGTHDHWWIDAGWCEQPPGATDWNNPGTWDPDPARYPNGLAPITERAHQLGMKTIVWFEPERVRPNTYLSTEHPDWLLKSSPEQTDNFLLNFADPAVQDWAIGHMGGLIASQHIDVYREDFNIDPLPFWKAADPTDRRGITQIRYVEGHLRYWASLRAQHSGLVIETCASGGRRMDVETMSVAINLLRSDFVLDALGNQVHTYGISSWVALSGDAVRITGSADDAYNARSAMAPSFHEALDVTGPQANWAILKKFAREWRAIADDLYGDYYPLLAFSAGQDAWTGWQFLRPEKGSGFIQVFRRPDSTAAVGRVYPRGLESRARYQLTDEATGTKTVTGGKQLMHTGIAVTLTDAPSATTIRIRRL